MNTTIAGLAREGGVGVETIRYYQRRGLLPTPERGGNGSVGHGGSGHGSTGHGGGIRRYGEQDIRRLHFIRMAKSAGFTLEQIAELLDLDATEDRPRAHALAQERIAALDARIAELQAARDALERLAHQCGNGSSGPCPILMAFENGR